MKVLIIFVTLAVVFSLAHSKSLPDEGSVVSIYTTDATTSGTSGLDVYQQIANNLAERISTPFYRFLGISSNKTEDKPTRKQANVDLLDYPEERLKDQDNEINTRDVEELSEEALKRSDKKPEKITLYNSYLPLNQRYELNKTTTDRNLADDDELTLDDVEPSPKTEGPFVFVLELLASLVQLAWGAIQAIFGPKSQG